MEQKEGDHSPSPLLECPSPSLCPACGQPWLMVAVGSLQLQPALCDEALGIPLLQRPSLLLRSLKGLLVPRAPAHGALDLALLFLSER